MRRALGASLVLAALGACSPGCSPGCSRGYEGPYRHVVLISLDTLRADHLGCYGGTRVPTPRIDALAAEGVLFRDVTTAAPTTLASHASIFTGTYPHTHGVARNGFTVSPDNVTLAEVLRDAGFRTAAFIGSFALDERFGIDQGFDHYDQAFDVAVADERTADQDQRRAEKVTDAVLAHLDATEAERRFLFVHYFDAHAPYDPPAPFAERHARPGRTRSDLADLRTAVALHQERIVGAEGVLGLDRTILEGLTPAFLDGADGTAFAIDEELAALYAGEVAYLDHEVGRLLDGLAARGLLEDALVVLTADHGETFHEHGDFWNHGLWLHDTTLRVPWILRLPRATSGGARTVEVPVSTIDIAPTVLELLGLAAPARVEGVSLVPLLSGRPLARGPVYSEATQPVRFDVEQGGWANRAKPRCVREGSWKRIDAPLLGRCELYDLARDPSERRNLCGTGLPEEERLAVELEVWARAAAPLPSGFDPSQMNEVRTRLGNLGYPESEEH